jgi:hypothetical protein
VGCNTETSWNVTAQAELLLKLWHRSRRRTTWLMLRIDFGQLRFRRRGALCLKCTCARDGSAPVCAANAEVDLLRCCCICCQAVPYCSALDLSPLDERRVHTSRSIDIPQPLYAVHRCSARGRGLSLTGQAAVYYSALCLSL